MAFVLENLAGAKLCSKECKVDVDCASFCVGCGRSCHLECHKVPDQMVAAVNAIPKNNRTHGYFGDLSYVKLVCDNCANLLNSASRPNFLSLFNDLANNQGRKSEVMVIADDSRSSQRTKKRKGDELDGVPADEKNLMTEMKRLIEKCMIKLNNEFSVQYTESWKSPIWFFACIVDEKKCNEQPCA